MLSIPTQTWLELLLPMRSRGSLDGFLVGCYHRRLPHLEEGFLKNRKEETQEKSEGRIS